MPKSSNQKLKLLYIIRTLMEISDERHPVSTAKIIEMLSRNGISAERKSIYDDIEALKVFGFDIEKTKVPPGGFYLASREFEAAELKLLVDSVLASQFITEKKTLQLIKKLEKLLSVHEAKQMRRQVYVSGRIKHMNESIFYSVDAIHRGIAEDRQITFKYFDYTVEKRKRYRRDGERYSISPYALTWDNENYYMIGYDADAEKIKHYRVDRMEYIALTELPREGRDCFDAHDMSVYTRRNFSMYGGEEARVTMEFDDSLAGVVIDRFGKDVMITRLGDGRFRISAQVAVSPQFYAWVFGLGGGARITAPESVKNGMLEMLESASAYYMKA